MHVRTDNSRDEYRIYSPRKYNDRFRRKISRHDDHHSHSSRHHPLKRPGHSQSNPYNSHSRLNRDSYYHSSPIIHERELPIHYNDPQVTHHRHSYSSESFKPSPRRETSPPSQTTTRKDYRSSFEPYNEMYYTNRSERYDISQNRIGSITPTPSLSPIYHSDSYPSTSMYNNSREQYPSSISPAMREMDYRTRDYPPMIDHHPINSNLSSKYYRSPPSYDDRLNFKRPRSMIRR